MTNAPIDRRIEIIDGADSDRSAIQHVSDLRALPFVVILGEPGIGKSTVLGTEAALEGVPVLKVRELMTGSTVKPSTTLFLDALDEYRTDGEAADKVHGLARAIAEAQTGRWRLSCRSEDWRKNADMAPIRKTAAGAAIIVVQLLPLDNTEAASVLTSLGEQDPSAFLARAKSLGASSFTENPLSLKLLHAAAEEGEKWPSTRYDLFASAIRALMFERNDEHKWTERHSADDILGATAKACLLLLTSGARAIWRSNDEPPDGGDSREYVGVHDLGLDTDLAKDMLDTPLFRGEGEAFEIMHRVVAEFLAGLALAKAVSPGMAAGAALPLSRAIALITAGDGSPPTELRGLYAWFAAHLGRLGDNAGVLPLIEAEAFTVLAYGDAAVFDTGARRAILANLGRKDPYFRASEVGVTAVGGLAGEDLRDDFAAILTNPPDGTHRLITVYEALAAGTPLPSLQPLLRSISLDPARPEWQRRRAIDAYLNGTDDPGTGRREMVDTLRGEPISVGREALRAQLMMRLPTGNLTVSDVKSLLADYQRIPRDSMMGRLFGLQRRLENEPLAELFDEPTTRWLPPPTDRGHGIEIEHVLDHALAGAIGSTPNLSAARLWRWTTNVREYPNSKVGDETAKALFTWLDAETQREPAFFDAILADDDPTQAVWVVTHRYIATTRRNPSGAVIRHLLTRASADATRAGRRRLLAIGVDIARRSTDMGAYWEAYDHVASKPDCKRLLKQLTTVAIDTWRIAEQKRAIKENRRANIQRAKNVRMLAPFLVQMTAGGELSRLHWAARVYFDGMDGKDHLVGVQRVAHITDEATTAAIVAGWKHLAMFGTSSVDAARLGTAEATGHTLFFETAAIAGMDLLVSEGQLPSLAAMPIEIAITVLRSSWQLSDQERRNQLEKWAFERLDLDPTLGATQLLSFWNAALDAGATQLVMFSRLLEEDARDHCAIREALGSLLETRPSMPPDALRSAVRAGAKHLSRTELLALADAALADSAVTGTQRTIWKIVAFAIDPSQRAARFLAEDDAAELFDDDLGFAETFNEVDDSVHSQRDAMIVRFLGRTTTPPDQLRIAVTRLDRLNELVAGAINALSAVAQQETGVALSNLVADPNLTAWRALLRHAQAQQFRLCRDRSFTHPTPRAVRDAIAGGPPVNACDLRAVVIEELGRLRTELHTTDTTPWKRYWNVNANGKVVWPLIENECRDHLLDRLRDRLKKYHVAIAAPEARRAEETRTDMLVVTGAGRNLPIEAKRHFHPDIWVAASTQLQGYASDPGADGSGIYLVFWFGDAVQQTPARPDRGIRPTSAVELEAMLVGDLPPELRTRIAVIVFDVSDPRT